MGYHTGRYFDGLTARRHDVAVAVDDCGLTILGEDGGVRATWDYADLTAEGRLGVGRLVEIGHAGAPEARLIVNSPEFAVALRSRRPDLFRNGPRSRHVWLWAGVSAAMMAVIAALLVFGLPLAGRLAARHLPIEWEIALGEAAVRQLAGGSPGCANPAGRAALERLVQRLAGAAASAYALDVTVAANGNVNALAAPGGRIVLYDGLIQAAEAPDEVAGVLAHEIAHVIERHPTAGLVRHLGLQLLIALAIGGGSGIGETLAQGGGMLAALAYTREDEAAADAIARDILVRAGIGTAGLARFFARLEAKERHGLGQLGGYLSTHPPLTERRRLAEAGVPAGPALSEAEWQALRTVCGR
jgi:predicted Zn-dependent protease